MAKAKRVAAPVKSSTPEKAAKAAPKTASARASIAGGHREHAGVKAAHPRSERLRLKPVTHSAILSRD